MAYGTLKVDKIEYSDGTNPDKDVDVADLVDAAPLSSPAFTGTPTAPTFGASTTAQIATIEYVDTEVAGVDLSAKADLTGDTFTGGVNLADGIKLTLGDGAGNDYNPGSYEVYENNDLYLKSNAGHMRHQVPASQGVLLEGPTGSLAKFIEGGACELYHADIKKLESTSAGVTVTGTVDATGAITSSGTVTSSAGVLGVGDALLAGNQTWTGVQIGDIHDASTAAGTNPASWQLDFGDGNNQKVTVDPLNDFSANAPTGLTAGQSGSIFITQPSSGATCNTGWNAYYKWPAGTQPSLTQTNSATDRLDYVVTSGTSVHVVLTADVK
jgi:hypothetical protein